MVRAPPFLLYIIHHVCTEASRWGARVKADESARRPRITVSTLGKFILLYLAQELERKGHLHRLVTNLYSGRQRWLKAFRNDPEKITAGRCRVAPWVEAARLGRALGNRTLSERMTRLSCDLFDRWASKQLEGTDVLLVRSLAAMRSMVRATEMGARTVLFRGSAHIETQYALLKEEYERWAVPFAFDRYWVEKETEEYDRADAVFVLSTFSKKTFRKRGFPDRRLIISNPGVDTDLFSPSGGPVGGRVLFAGGIGLEKGIPYLAEAALKLGLKSEDLLLVGAMDPACGELVRKMGVSFTHFPPVPQEKLRDLYRSSAVLVLPSVQDGFGMVILEAMACGCPVIASTHTGGPDVIRDGENGYVVPPRDAEALADRIERVLGSKGNRSRMSRGALKTALMFSWAGSAERLLSGCKKLAGDRG
ncbi:MAG: glycosyltransferase family 4 protein [Nitrospirae bacterium]|nr:glycosyltransferase family 4 protein [Nitrospirota bacterium]